MALSASKFGHQLFGLLSIEESLLSSLGLIFKEEYFT